VVVAVGTANFTIGRGPEPEVTARVLKESKNPWDIGESVIGCRGGISQSTGNAETTAAAKRILNNIA
jgi:hypothetical protein